MSAALFYSFLYHKCKLWQFLFNISAKLDENIALFSHINHIGGVKYKHEVNIWYSQKQNIDNQ